MRTDRENSGLILEELRLGRLRQGWGYDGSQDLHLLVKKRQAGEEFTSAERDAWRNRPMLGGEHGINTGDIVLVPTHAFLNTHPSYKIVWGWPSSTPARCACQLNVWTRPR